LFVNNAINHGVLAPLGIAEAKRAGKSIFFLLESNPGPGLGLLSAYWLCGKDEVKQSTPGAMVIHFLGGIHEIYFPYVLMNPPTVVAMIAGGMSATATFVLMHAGLVATPAPGSIFAYIAMAPKGGLLPVLSGVFIGAVASFLVALPIVSRSSASGDVVSAFAKAKQTVQARQAQPPSGGRE
jgi:PTS system mannitol-specific IIC component